MIPFKKIFLKKNVIIIKSSLLCLLIFLLALSSCQKDDKNHEPIKNDYRNQQESKSRPYIEAASDEVQFKDDKSQTSPAIIDTADTSRDDTLLEKEILKYRPNELGQVMILMYHKIGHPESAWTRSPGNFRQDLINLYENGYCLVNLLDYVRGNIDIEAGKSPVVLTFDDSTQGHFNFIEMDNNIILDPDCAVAILEDFYKQFPDFGKGATFYINFPYPFGQAGYIEEKLEFLVDNGYEIGNHTYSHANLSNLSDLEAVEEIALHSSRTNEILPGYEVRSLALTYGQYPKNEKILAEGIFKEHSYNNEAILLIGSNPAPSPFSVEFDFIAIPRVRASEIDVYSQGLYDWIDYFKKYPERKYISDGNVGVVSMPQELKGNINDSSIKDKEIFLYNP